MLLNSSLNLWCPWEDITISDQEIRLGRQDGATFRELAEHVFVIAGVDERCRCRCCCCRCCCCCRHRTCFLWRHHHRAARLPHPLPLPAGLKLLSLSLSLSLSLCLSLCLSVIYKQTTSFCVHFSITSIAFLTVCVPVTLSLSLLGIFYVPHSVGKCHLLLLATSFCVYISFVLFNFAYLPTYVSVSI